MGRNKIKIEKISNERNRQVTFYKRKKGLLKKAMELSVLCGVKVMLCIVDKRNKSILFSSERMEKLFADHIDEKMRSRNYLTLDDYQRIFRKKKSDAFKIIQDRSRASSSSMRQSSKLSRNIDYVESVTDTIELEGDKSLSKKVFKTIYSAPTINEENDIFILNSSIQENSSRDMSSYVNDSDTLSQCSKYSKSNRNSFFNQSDKETQDLDSSHHSEGRPFKARAKPKIKSKFHVVNDKKFDVNKNENLHFNEDKRDVNEYSQILSLKKEDSSMLTNKRSRKDETDDQNKVIAGLTSINNNVMNNPTLLNYFNYPTPSIDMNTLYLNMLMNNVNFSQMANFQNINNSNSFGNYNNNNTEINFLNVLAEMLKKK